MKEAYMVDNPLGEGKVEVLKTSDMFNGNPAPRRGKVRDVYDMGDHMFIVTSDRISAYDVVYPTLIPNKGPSLHALSIFWFNETKDVIPNHLIEEVDSRTMKVIKADRVDVEWVCRAYLYGSAWRAYNKGARTISGVDLPDGLVMAEELPEVILTPTTKEESGHDEEISKAEAIEAGLSTKDEWDQLEEATFKLFERYQSVAKRHGMIIPDFKLEFGRLNGELIQIDEPPTHDSARYWAEKFYEPGKPQEATCLDKEFLRSYLRNVGYMGDGSPPVIPAPVVREVSKRCVASYKVLSGQAKLADFNLKTVDQVMEELR
ncbi:MAG: phosphoribosylaminoimidazolesuccinocarboxamide synthase [Candidatus Bathyarchaeota archaeon]|nr:phosphoribosylaminoimidazolesuccinocarboxamide synthase [Candidatus Bathyarchaeota archaeon]